MADEATITPEVAVIPQEVEVPKTMEQINDTVVVKDTVGLDKFLDVKRQNKEQARTIKDLQARIEAGATHEDVSADIEDISQDYPDVDRNFLNKLLAVAEKRADDKLNSRLSSYEQKDKDIKIDNAFNTHFKIAMDSMPEFKAIVNPAIIKTLSLDPKNSNKNFAQIIEETYGNALTGKRTIETTTPGGGKDTEPLNYEKARGNPEYFDIVMNNPKLKAEYNNQMINEGFS